MTWWRTLLRRRQQDRELDAELRYHFDRLVDDYVRAGLPSVEARRRARLEFGGDAQVKDACRDVGTCRPLRDVAQDVRFAIRLLLRERAFAATSVLALALSMSVVAMMTTVLNGYYFRGLPGGNATRILSVGTRLSDGSERGLSFSELRDLQAQSRSFARLGAFAGGVMSIRDPGLPTENVSGRYITANAFQMLEVMPALGRGFREEDDRPGAPPVVVLGHRLWLDRYGGNPDAVGRTVLVNGQPATVIAVMPDGFEFPFLDVLWRPLASMPDLAGQPREERTLSVFGVLGEDMSPAAAQAELDTIAAAWAREHASTNRDVRLVSSSFGQQQVGRFFDDVIPAVLAGTALFVLLIACANVANLLLARSAARGREIAIRTAVGATRWRIVRQLLVECLLLAVIAGVVGAALSRMGVRFVADAFQGLVPYWMHFGIDAPVVAVLAAVCVGATLLFGTVPAICLAKGNIGDTMKEAGTAGLTPRRRTLTRGLLVAQIAITMALLTGGGLMLRSFLLVYRADSPIDADRLLAVRLALPEPAYGTAAEQAVFFETLLQRLATAPEIRAAAAASTPPFARAGAMHLRVRGRHDAQRAPAVTAIGIDRRYFQTVGLPLLRGRSFDEGDARARGTAIVNRRLADLYFSGEDPVGAQIRLARDDSSDGPIEWLTIVGIAPDVRQAFSRGPAVYVPLHLNPGSSGTVIVRPRESLATAAAVLRREVARLDPEVSLFPIRTLGEIRDDSRVQPRLVGTLLAVFAGIALVLSVVGTYSVSAYAVRRRMPEIGVRVALGATPGQVVWLFTRQGIVPLALGLGLGTAAAVGVGFVLRSVLIQTSPADPLMLIGALALLSAAAGAACVLPARRAAHVSPVTILRHE